MFLQLELLRLRLELRVVRFELGLLLLEPPLRHLQRAALLFELLVRHPELLLLRLQLFGLPLGFFDKCLQSLAVHRRAQRRRDSVAATLEKIESAGLGRMDECELEDAVSDVVDDGRTDGHVSRRAGGECGFQREIAFRKVLQHRNLFLPRRQSDEAVAPAKCRRQRVAVLDALGCHKPEVGARRRIHRGGRCVDRAAQDVQRALPELADVVLSLQALEQRRLYAPHPFLACQAETRQYQSACEHGHSPDHSGAEASIRIRHPGRNPGLVGEDRDHHEHGNHERHVDRLHRVAVEERHPQWHDVENPDRNAKRREQIAYEDGGRDSGD